MKKISFKDLSNDEILTRDELKRIAGGNGSGGMGEDGSGGAGIWICEVYISESGQTLTKSAVSTQESEMRGLTAWSEFYRISGRSVNCSFTPTRYT